MSSDEEMTGRNKFMYSGSIGGVVPVASNRKSHPKMKIVPVETIQSKPHRRSAIVTADAQSQNLRFVGDGLLFFVDRLFHRRS